MDKMNEIMDFGTYSCVVNESLSDGMQTTCNKAFINFGMIEMPDGNKVDPKDIVDVVNKAISYIASEFAKTFKLGNRMNIILLPHSSKYKTMAVDQYLNLYMNATFIYGPLNMNYRLVAAVITHEIFHVLFNHIERGQNWLSAKGKPVNAANWHDTNLAADVEVNQTLVKTRMINPGTLVNYIHGIYLENSNFEGGEQYAVVPMEVILENEEYMEMLRKMSPPPTSNLVRNEVKTIKTSSEWDRGYKDGYNKIARLIKKYGPRKALDKLIEDKIINAVGEVYTRVGVEDISSLNLLQIRSFDEYIKESYGIDQLDKGCTYKDGYETGARYLIKTLFDSLNPGEGGDGGGKVGGESDDSGFETGINRDELEEVELPGKSKGGRGNDGLPSNVRRESDGDDGKGENESDAGKGKGSKGGFSTEKSESSEGDATRIEDDLRSKAENGELGKKRSGGGSGSVDEESIGDFGSFSSRSLGDDVLEDAGYSREQIADIRKVVETNKSKNSPEMIEKTKIEIKNSMKSDGFLAKALSQVDVESSKYRNIWKKVMNKFLSMHTRRAGNKTRGEEVDWQSRRKLALGQVGVRYTNVDQEPQDVNIYVDVSGSMNIDLLEVICSSLFILSKQYKYSGMNIGPWASTSNGITRIENFSHGGENEVVQEILRTISKGAAECGGGTDAAALVSSIVSLIEISLKDPRKKKKKDDVHVVITDGLFDFHNIEKNISDVAEKITGRRDVAEATPKNIFWMIYDASNDLMKSFEKEINKGEVIFINSESVANEKKLK